MTPATFVSALVVGLLGAVHCVGMCGGIGGGLWRYLKPVGQRFIPARSPGQAFGLGLVWVWLPCGLVYTALAWSLVSGSPVRGAILMPGFGLGTLPALVGMGMAGPWILAWRDRPLVGYTAGLVLVGLAVSSLWHGLAPGGPATGHVH